MAEKAYLIRGEFGKLFTLTIWGMAKQIVERQKEEKTILSAKDASANERTLIQRRAARLTYLMQAKNLDAQSAYDMVMTGSTTEEVTVLTTKAVRDFKKALESAIASSYAQMILAFDKEMHEKVAELGLDAKILGLLKDTTYSEIVDDPETTSKRIMWRKAFPAAKKDFLEMILPLDWDEAVYAYQNEYPMGLIDMNYK